jgi:hypothetical protein
MMKMNDKFASPRWMGDLHHKQFDWPVVGRIAWWVLLLTPAVLCWAATKEDRRIRYGVFAATALIVVFGMAADGGDDNSIDTVTDQIEVEAGEGIGDGAEPLPEPTLEEPTDDSSDAPVEDLDSGETVTTEAPATTEVPATTEAPATTAPPTTEAPTTTEAAIATEDIALIAFRLVMIDGGIYIDWSDSEILDAADRYCSELLRGLYDNPVDALAQFDGWYWSDPFMAEIYSYEDLGYVMGALAGIEAELGNQACAERQAAVIDSLS